MSVLDLPHKKQLELAQRMGLSHDAWVEEMKQSLERTDEFLEELKTKESKLSPDQIKHMQAKMDSGNPI